MWPEQLALELAQAVVGLMDLWETTPMVVFPLAYAPVGIWLVIWQKRRKRQQADNSGCADRHNRWFEVLLFTAAGVVSILISVLILLYLLW